MKLRFCIKSGICVICGTAFLLFGINVLMTHRMYDEMYTYKIQRNASELDEKGKLYEFFRDRNEILLFVGIFSYVKFTDRRNAIRRTWLSFCKNSKLSVCRFMMDGRDNKGLPISANKRQLLAKENDVYGDIVILDAFEGINFAYRFYTSFLWAAQRYKFDFFLRVDDDHYVCFDRLLYELPHRKNEQNLYWGYQHCVEGITRIDEGWSLFGGDLINEFIRNREGLICHKYGDQAVALWLLELKDYINITWFGDVRIRHTQVENNYDSIVNDKRLCSNYLSLHGSYPDMMFKLHEKHKLRDIVQENEYEIPKVIDNCPGLHNEFKLNTFYRSMRCYTTLCIYEPVWSFEAMYVGRQKRVTG